MVGRTVHLAPGLMPVRPITHADRDTLTDGVRRRGIRWFKRRGLLDAHAATDMLA